MERISNEKKAKEIAQSSSFFWTNEDDCEKSIIDTVSLRKAIFNAVLQAMQWKDAQLDKAFDKALEHHCNSLKKGKITQYGMDNVFAFVQNVRTLLNSEL